MATKSGNSARPQIFAVDDDPALLDLLKRILSPIGDVATACDGIEALAMIQRGYRPDVVVLDWMMPRLDGMKVCERLKELSETKDVPVIMLTAKDTADDLIEGIDVGVRYYVTKPFGTDFLVEKVKSALGL